MNGSRTSVYMVAAVFYVLSATAIAGHPRCTISFDSAELDICSGEISPVNEVLAPLAALEMSAETSVRVVKFDGPVGREQVTALESLGAEVLGYAPHHAYVVRMPPETNEAASSLGDVLWTGPFLPVWKVSVNLATELAGGGIVARAGVSQLTVSLHPGAAPGAVRDAMRDIPGLSYALAESAGSRERLVFDFVPEQLAGGVEALSRDENVAAINLRWPPRLLNSQAGWLHQSGISAPNPERPVFDQGIFGCGEVIGVLDSGLHIDHCSFEDTVFGNPNFTSCGTGSTCPAVTPDFAHRKVGVYYKWSGLAGGMEDLNAVGHGTHVTGSVAGNNPATGGVDCTGFTTPGGITDLDGSAPGAQLVFQEAGPALEYIGLGGTVEHAADIAFQNGARIHSNSWGFSCRDAGNNCIPGCQMPYHASSQDADTVVWNNPELALFVAAGNSGDGCGPGADVGAPSNAKNVFSIGSNQRGIGGAHMSAFSSRGPANDRRTRPDITAQGGSIESAHNTQTCGTRTLSGTSMATPTAAGLGALVREYLARGFYPTGIEDAANAIPAPSGALIRAMMINGAAEIGGVGANPPAPNQDQGWGRTHLDNVLFFDGDSRQLWLHDDAVGLNTGNVATHSITVFAGEPLKVTLVWHDFPALVNANPHIVNQLRLEVETPSGEVWTQKLPPGGGLINADPLQDITTTAYDDRNTVHQITFAAPAAGNYEIRVRGINVPQGPQPYALAVTAAFQPVGQAGLNITPVITDFGVQRVGQVSAPLAVTLESTGAATLNISNVDAPSAPFFLFGGSCASPPIMLNPGDTCTLEYTFAPTTGGAAGQALLVDSNDPNSPHSITLGGSGEHAVIDVQPPVVDFLAVPVGNSLTLPLEVINPGNFDVTVFTPDGLGPLPPEFDIQPGGCAPFPFTLIPGEVCQLDAVFTPAAAGAVSHNNELVHDATAGSAAYVLQGAGVPPAPQLAIAPVVHDFGVLAVGQVSAPATVMLSNAGSADLDINSVASTSAPFTQTGGSCAPVTLAPGENCQLEFTFEPTATGAFAITLSVDSSDPASPHDFELQGEGVSTDVFEDRFEQP